MNNYKGITKVNMSPFMKVVYGYDLRWYHTISLPPTSAAKLIPTATIQTQNSNSVEAEISLEEKLVRE